jgi:hypothetical protein
LHSSALPQRQLSLMIPQFTTMHKYTMQEICTSLMVVCALFTYCVFCYIDTSMLTCINHSASNNVQFIIVYCVLCVDISCLMQVSIQLTVLASWSASFAVKRSFEWSRSNDFMRLFTSSRSIVSGATCWGDDGHLDWDLQLFTSSKSIVSGATCWGDDGALAGHLFFFLFEDWFCACLAVFSRDSVTGSPITCYK